MPEIDPWNFSPAGPLNRLNAYFLCTWMRVSYYDVSVSRDALAELIGANDVRIYQGPGLQHTEVAVVPGEGDLLVVRGSSPPTQILQLVLDRTQTGSTDHAGLLHRQFSVFAEALWEEIEGTLQPVWTAAGHSLGGAIADILSDFGARRLCTAGAPRTGNLTYAQSRTNSIYLRLTNQEDLVTKVPVSTNTDWDALGIPPVPSLGFPGQELFRHWGTRVNFFSDGTATRPPEQSTLVDLNDLFTNFNSPSLGIAEHLMPEYLRRIRAQIPVRFPADGVDDDYPGLFELDEINERLNDLEGVSWEIDGRNSESLLRLLRTMNSQAIAEAEDVGPDEIPFRCG